MGLFFSIQWKPASRINETRWVRWAALVIVIALLYGCGSGSSGPDESQPEATQRIMSDTTWPTWSTPGEAGFSSTALDSISHYVRTLNTTGLVVVVDGKILHAQGDVTVLSYVASDRKSILSILYGIVVANGEIDLGVTIGELGIDDLQGLLPIEKEATVYDLITARSGVYHPPSNAGSDVAFAPQRGSQEPGTYFLYNNWDFNVAGAVYEMETERNIYDALQEDLAVPLGMEDFDRDRQRKIGDATMSQYPAYHIWLSTRDMARIGELMLRGGIWDGEQLVPAEWVERSTRAITPLEEMNPDYHRASTFGYGMMWWSWDGPDVERVFEGAFTARGAYGQYITVVPELDMVVAHKTAVGGSWGFPHTPFSDYLVLLERLVDAAVAR